MTEDVLKDHESMATACIYNIIFTNDIVCSLIVDGIGSLRCSTLYRNGIKHAASMVEGERRNYERRMNQIVNNSSEAFADMNERFYECVKTHIETLYWTIKAQFDKVNVNESETLSRLELARTVAEFSVKQHDVRMRDLQNADKRFSSFNMSYLRMTKVSNRLDELMDSFRIGQTVDLNTEQCNLAMHILADKLASSELISKSIE